MQNVDVAVLEWLHDCCLETIVYEANTEGDRDVTLTICCPTDLGFALWAGKTLTIKATRVAASRHLMHVYGSSDAVDAVRPEISVELRETVDAGRKMGIAFPTTEITVVFHSGSTLELICDAIQVEVGP